MKPYQLFACLSLLGGVLSGCRKDPLNALPTEEQRIYITHRDPATNFAAARTFAVAETVVVIEGGSSRQQYTPADQALVQAFATAMEGRGYTRVSNTARPDFGVQISRIIRTSTGTAIIGNQWGFWDPGFWGPGWGWGPGMGWGAPVWGTATYEVREGMLMFDVVDLRGSTGTTVRVAWNGLVRGPGLSNASAATDIVTRLFSQSSYIQR